MKQLAIFFIAVLAAFSSSATILTVDNNPNNPGQYTTVQAAITAASAGDSIYISGSTASYGTFSLNKRLSVFGTGYNPQKQVPLVSIVATVNLDTVTSVSGASGSKIYGLYTSSISDNYGAKNITLERNEITSTTYLYSGGTSSNWVIKNNVLINGNLSVNNSSNILIENNLAYAYQVYNSNQPTVVVNHNIFMYNIGSGYTCVSTVTFAIFTNNIFWGATPLGSGVGNCVFNNNLTFQTVNDVIPGAGNSGTNNLVTINPNFVSVPDPNAAHLGSDYNVTGASAAHNAGTDGADLGIYGGVAAMPNLSGMPAIPQMIDMNIANPVIAPAGTLNVTFKAKKNN
jgi:hypothetical protein